MKVPGETVIERPPALRRSTRSGEVMLQRRREVVCIAMYQSGQMSRLRRESKPEVEILGHINLLEDVH